MPHPYSVLMSVYERERPEYLCESIQSMLEQTVQPQEIVLVCDGPLPSPLDDAVSRMRKRAPDVLHIVRLAQNQGLGSALHQGLAVCQNEYVARMDSDDLSAAARCEKQLARMEADRLDVCGASVIEIDAKSGAVVGNRILPARHEELLAFSRRRNPFNHPSVMFRKSSVVRAGGYQNVPRFEDYDLWTRLIQCGARFGNLPEALLYMRVDREFYARRGGWGYLTANWNFWKRAGDRGFVTRREIFENIFCRGTASLLPNRLRIWLYRYCLHGGVQS